MYEANITGEGSEPQRRAQNTNRSVPTRVTVRLDAPARLALAALIADGTPIDEAVREAVISAGARWLDQQSLLSDDAPKGTSDRRRRQDTAGPTPGSRLSSHQRAARLTAEEAAALKEWAARKVADAPPPSACQVYVLREAFIEGRIVEACDARHGSDRQPRSGLQRLECRAPRCFEDDDS